MERIEFEVRLSEEISSLKASAKQLTQNLDEANDLIQETLLKALRFWNSFKEGTNFKGWLYTIMRNTFIDSYHFKLMRRAESIEDSEMQVSLLSVVSVRNQAESKNAMDDIRCALEKLSKELYAPFNMYFEGYKYHEIAEYLSVPIGTVKTRIYMARKILKRSLAPYHYYRATA